MKITVGLMRDLEKQVSREEISYSRMVEILNETAASQPEELDKMLGGGDNNSITKAAIWLSKQNYQTEQGEQEYEMYFDVDIPKMLNEYADQQTASLRKELEEIKAKSAELIREATSVYCHYNGLIKSQQDFMDFQTLKELQDLITLTPNNHE